MYRIRFKNTISVGDGSWVATTAVTSPPTFAQVDGWQQAVLPFHAGRVPANLWGKAPAGDCYILHATMYTTRVLASPDVLQVKTRAPNNIRDAFLPAPGNTHLTLVRPDDILDFDLSTTGDAYLELLLEPLAAENEMGDTIMDLMREMTRQKGYADGTAEISISANFVLPPFTGNVRVTSTAGAGISLTLPAASGQALKDNLWVNRNGAGAVAITPAGTDTINSLGSVLTVSTNNTSKHLVGAGTNWSAV